MTHEVPFARYGDDDHLSGYIPPRRAGESDLDYLEALNRLEYKLELLEMELAYCEEKLAGIPVQALDERVGCEDDQEWVKVHIYQIKKEIKVLTAEQRRKTKAKGRLGQLAAGVMGWFARHHLSSVSSEP